MVRAVVITWVPVDRIVREPPLVVTAEAEVDGHRSRSGLEGPTPRRQFDLIIALTTVDRLNDRADLRA